MQGVTGTDGQLAFTLDVDNGIFTMSGNLKDRAGNPYSLEVIGEIIEGKNGKSALELSLQLEGDSVSLNVVCEDVTLT